MSDSHRIYHLDIDVLEASSQRISKAFDRFSRLFLSFSGGKDSGVVFHLVMEEAKKRNRKVGVLILDWECQFTHTIEFIDGMVELYKDHIELYWIALPIRTVNGSSQI